MSQCDRILSVLADGRPHSVPDIHRKAGTSRLNSRVAELRNRGYDIVCDRVKGRKGPSAYRYTLLNPPDDVFVPRAGEAERMEAPKIPRTPETRYRVYTRVYDDLRCIATAADPEALGVAIVTLGREGEFEGLLLGVMDAPDDETPGVWLARPWCPE